MSRCLMQVYCIHVIDMLHLNITNMDEKKCTLYLLNNFWFPSLHYPFLNEEKIIIFCEPNSFMHMFNVSTLYRQSIKLFQQKLW